MPDREKYIEVLSKTVKAVKVFNEDCPIKFSLECIEDILELLKVKTGKWIDNTYGQNSYDIECPFCNQKWSVIDNCTETFDYCPGCGAKLI